MLAVLAFVGFAFAVSGGHFALPGSGWHQGRPNLNGSHWNMSARNMTGCPQNASAEFAQFKTAVESGDYASAKALHEQYGFGGRLFGLLNETTFPKYSQAFKLRDELMGELGLDGQPAATHRGCATGDRSGFARGNHRRPWQGANATAGASPTPSE